MLTTIIYALIASLSLLLLGNITQSPYGVNAFSVSKEWKENIYSIPNILNWFQRAWNSQIEQRIESEIEDKIEGSKSFSREQKKEKRIIAHAYKRLSRAVFSPESFVVRIELWNPKDSDKRRLVGSKEYNRELKGQKEGYGAKGAGNSPFRLVQIALGIWKLFINNYGTTFQCVDIDAKAVKKDGIEAQNFAKVTVKGETKMVTVGDIFDLAEQYHAAKEAQRKKRQEQKDSSSETEPETVTETTEVSGDYTVEDYINGKVDLSDIEDVSLLEQFREDEELSSGQKGAVTRRLNELT